MIPWGVRAFYGTDNQGQFGPFKPGGRDIFGKAVTQTNVAFTSLFATIPLFAGELARDGSGVTTDSLMPAPRGTTQFIGGNFWASPLSGLDAAGNRLTTLTGVANDAGVIDTNRGSSNVTSYISPGTTKTHSHLITLAAITNPQTDFTYDNINGAGIKYAGSLPTSETAISVQFNQSEVLLELNDGAFTFNSSTFPSRRPHRIPGEVTPAAARAACAPEAAATGQPTWAGAFLGFWSDFWARLAIR